MMAAPRAWVTRAGGPFTTICPKNVGPGCSLVERSLEQGIRLTLPRLRLLVFAVAEPATQFLFDLFDAGQVGVPHHLGAYQARSASPVRSVNRVTMWNQGNWSAAG